jgi:serralysin
MPSVFSLAQIIQQLQTQWGGSYEGTTEHWAGTGPISYYVGSTPYSSGSGEIAYWTPMTALMTSRAALAFELWDDLIARDLIQATTAASAQIQFEYATRTYNGSGVLSTNGGTYSFDWANGASTNSYGTTNYNISRDEIWLNSNWTSHNADNDMFFGGYGFQTYMHEIGHSLGLSHPGTYNAGNGGSITFANSAEYSLDNRQYTIMSYFGGYAPGAGWQQDGTFSSWLYSSTPMLDDVAAIQAIYGADMTTRATDTTYGFHSNAGRDVFDFTIDKTPIVTVWDAGGTDTIDLSGYSANQRIDLHAGTYSDVGGMLNNVAIAYNVTIENAIGGSGNDTFYGNEADNRLTGGAGNDTVDGGAGTDTGVFSGSYASYRIAGLGGTSVRVSGPDGIDTLSNIELLQFSDRIVTWPFNVAVVTNKAAAPYDFNGDGKADILLQNDNGTPAVWLMDGTADSFRGSGLANPGPAWHAKDAADFNSDGKSDIVWQNTDGTPAVWLMDGVNVLSTGPALPNPGPTWHALEAGDFNGDGKADILWQNNDCTPAVWLMDGINVLSTGPTLANPGPTWQVRDAADFNGDGKADILWQNTNGTPAVWLMNGTDAFQFGPLLPNPGASWHEIAGGDFNGDGKADILWQDDNGTPAVWLMDGVNVRSFGPALTNPGAAWHAMEAEDFNSDGKADILWQNDNGTPAVWLMNGVIDVLRGSPLYVSDMSWHI